MAKYNLKCVGRVSLRSTRPTPYYEIQLNESDSGDSK